MSQNTLLRWTNLLVFGLTIFLIFCLIFESFIELPILVVWLGRWHPLILHFPIVLLLMAAILGFFEKKVPPLLLTLSVLSALVTAITGFFLGTQSSPKGGLIFWHQWMGSLLALLAVLWFVLANRMNSNSKWIKGLQLIIIILVGFTGHYGGMITHGEDFLALPNTRKNEKLPENPLIYKHVVSRILDNNCVSCHNPNKKKGELLMTTLEALRIGGESGPALVDGQPEKSELIRRLHLPIEDEDHMPPDGKKPLNENEIRILERWIVLGASDTLRLNHLDENEQLALLVKTMMQPKEIDTWKTLPKVADTTIDNLASDYLTVKRIAGNSNALSVSLFMPPEYDTSLIGSLERVAANIVELDLSGLPLGAIEMEVVAKCKNLERLEVDQTSITDEELAKLAGLNKLKHLKAYGTKITDESLPVIKRFKTLKTLYIWDTNISEPAIIQLKKEMPILHVNYGIEVELETLFKAKDSSQ